MQNRHDLVSRLSEAERGRLIAEQTRELKDVGEPARWAITMHPLLGYEREDTIGQIVRATDPEQHQMIRTFADYIKVENGYTGAPYNLASAPDDPDTEAYLILSKRFLTTFPVAAGAAVFERREGASWSLCWIYLHPLERHTGCIDRAWADLEQAHGEFDIDGPFSEAMIGFLVTRGIAETRTPGLDRTPVRRTG